MREGALVRRGPCATGAWCAINLDRMRCRWVTSIAEVLAPVTCAACGVPGTPLCPRCLAALAAPGWPRCDGCGCPQPLPVGRCPECRPSLARARQAAAYEAVAAAVMRGLKDRGRRDLAVPLARLVVARCPPPPPGAALVPVPLGPRRLRERGYNQSDLLARELAGRWGAVTAAGMLARVREEPPQRGAGRTARARQASGAFATTWRGNLPEEVWLVDDVITTGATLGACAAALRRAGVRRVCAVAVARAMRP
ncbi:MAG: ComF family protein [Thermoleophilia bacterium]|nr:ComF family protein [Thermoleophilia bacterium]